MGAETLFSVAEYAARELALFAAVGILLGGLDDLLVDLLWLAGKRPPRRSLAMLGPARRPGKLALFIPAWDEAEVIGPMLRHTLCAFARDDVTLFVGGYPNDHETIARIADAAARDERVRIAICPRRGPTTKADCLNAIWLRMREEEQRTGRRFKAVVLHDAEDVVHPDEARLFDRLIEEHDLVQIPVVPLIDSGRRWIAGHYGDEFAEAHGKDLAVRDALDAGVPSAGVGCAIRRETLARIAAERRDGPFDADSLTEDYELGLRLAGSGATGSFAAISPRGGEPPIAVRAHFPEHLGAAVRQKTRWITGIALSGWERLGWQGGLAERWMRLRDRRAVLAALILSAAYAALLLGAFLAIVAAASPLSLAPVGPMLATLLIANALLLGWRLAMRAFFASRLYGPTEGLLAIPRALISNIIAIMAARRAVTAFLLAKRGAPPRWDKT
ncbi:MAG: glycosyl transferase family protein, partial [Sphingomonadales bacterium]|nr:glycosyl transferase family protein [Sphingomonadales bacterium]